MSSMKQKQKENSKKIDNALRAIKYKPQVERDFSVYVSEDGENVSTKERLVSSVPNVARKNPRDDEVFYENGLPNHEFLKDHFFHEGRLKEDQIIRILDQATDLLRSEPNLLTVPAPVNVCGDIHGQYYDLMKLFDVGGHPSTTPYLFLGDYVDRGSFSIECLVYLYSLKLNYPETFWMLRGNHECKHLTGYFTFKRECLHKYSLNVYKALLASFNTLPLAAIMSNQFFCVHGGISPELESLDDIIELNRFREPPSRGLMCDLLWADPIEDYDEDSISSLFLPNENRGCSYAFTYRASCAFLEKTGLLSIVRAHELQDAGFRMYKKTETLKFPSLITMFSAPNYLDSYNNKAAILKYENNVMNIRQFNASPHPYWLPNFMDVFEWSIPFVTGKVVELLSSVLNVCTDMELEEETELARAPLQSFEEVTMDSPTTPTSPGGKFNFEAFIKNQKQSDVLEDDPLETKRVSLRNKIMAIGRVSRMYQVLREEKEKVEQLRELSGGSTLPKGALLGGSTSLNNHILTFEEARLRDLKNEAMPPSLEEIERREKEEKEILQKRVVERVNSDPHLQRLARRLSDFN